MSAHLLHTERFSQCVFSHRYNCTIHTFYISHTARLPLKNGNQPLPVCDSKTAEVKCLSSWKEAFCVSQKERAPYFPISFLPPLLLIHIHARDTSSANTSSRYCQLSDSEDECKMVAVYSQPIFQSYPAALWVSLAGPFEVFSHFQHLLSVTIVETTWTLPLPVCSRHYLIDDIMYGVSDCSNT